jgi:peptidoglycan/LPS O-acetylase OafA/YrhL
VTFKELRAAWSRMAKVQSSGELPGIEILRFVSALAVVLWHYQHFFFSGPYDDAAAQLLRPHLPAFGALSPFYLHGSAAVQVFWTISGFVFYWVYSERIATTKVGVFEFGVRRFSRLYPLHIATLLLVAVLQTAYSATHSASFIYEGNGYPQFIYQLFFASNWFQWQAYSFNGPIWSVSAEILIYFAFFAVVRIFGAGLVVASTSALAFYLIQESPNWQAATGLSGFVFSCGVYFFVGGIAAKLWRYGFSLPVAICIGAAAVLAWHFGLTKSRDALFLPLAFCLVIVFAQIDLFLSRRILNPVLVFGNATYSSYLLQFPLQLAIVIAVDALGYSRMIFLNPLLLCAYVVTVVMISLAAYHWFEMPAQGWLRRRLTRPDLAPTQAHDLSG